MDLFRLPKNCDLAMLNIPNIYKDCLCLIEWPERMADQFIPKRYIDIDFIISKDESQYRSITIELKGEPWNVELFKSIKF